MPFKSSSQKKKCFATKGFGGKVDCKMWLAETPKGKKLPEKIKPKSIKKKSK